jgi:transcriptional regulator with XRE-family HTH domain
MNRIKQLRDEYKMTQLQLAQKMNKTQQTISLYENGTNEPDLDGYILLSKLFNCSVEYIAGKSDIRNLEKNEVNSDKIDIGLLAKDYENITDNQRKQIKEFAKLVLKDNLKNKDNN